MSKIIVAIADGFEEIEAVSIIDVCRRAGLDVTIAGVEGSLLKGAHGINIEADVLLKAIKSEDFDMVVLPGGLPNAFTLAEDLGVQNLLKEMKSLDKYVCAICAAPYALHCAEVLNQNYTCYPSFEQKIRDEGYDSSSNVVVDGKVITSRGPATAMEFALEIVKTLCGAEKYQEVRDGLLAK